MEAQPRLVGRDAESDRLLAALEAAARGDPQLLVVHGEAGIGKTALLRGLADSARDQGFHVLWGTCLRFGSEVSSYLPFLQALSAWLQSATGPDRERAVGAARSIGELLPSLARAGGVDTGRVLLQLSMTLDRITDDGPTLLVLDDVHWADPSSLDVLSYTVAGFRPGQRMLVVASYRDTELVEGHRLHGWLADVLRMPRVRFLELGRLDRWETEQLVSHLSGERFTVRLAEEVYQRGSGNPYLTELLVAEAGERAGDKSRHAQGLGDALLGAWHRLTPTSRRLMQVLAVGGMPVSSAALRELAAGQGLVAEDVAAGVAEAAAQGLVLEETRGSVWFRHPLIAEVVAETLPPDDLVEVHRRCAEVWIAAQDVDERDRANHVALHLAGSRQYDDAFRWSLRAAAEAAAVQAGLEQAHHLATACSLLTSLSPTCRGGVDDVDLLTRAAAAAYASGDAETALGHYERALAQVDRGDQPLSACRIMLAIDRLRDLVGLDSGMSPAYANAAKELTTGLPPSEERALACAHAAFTEVWKGLPEAVPHAEEAVSVAEQVQSDVALSWALAVRSQTRSGSEAALEDARLALALARRHGDPEYIVRAGVLLNNCYQERGQLVAAADMTYATFHEVLGLGSPHHAASLGGIAAELNLTLGRFATVHGLLREVLALRVTGNWGATARCIAAILSGLEGDPQAAEQHLRRAREVLPNPSPVGDEYYWSVMQVDIARGAPRSALELAEWVIPQAVGVNRLATAEYLRWAGEAAAELAETEDGSGGTRGEAAAWLERIEGLLDTPPQPFEATGPQDVLFPALGALYAADRARSRRDRGGLLPLWRDAAEATGQAEMRYHHARSLLHLADALLQVQSGRGEAADALGRARAIAAEIGALPLLARIDQLAVQVHLAVPSPSGPTTVDNVTTAPWHLTNREREILGHLVEGLTYGQIARALVISEKTVSSHVSSLLRKTGTTSRRELAALALRSPRS
jgi:DNA-binding CsgD family transcriptional regulator/tetratricopeptide (TPR) repeat protein